MKMLKWILVSSLLGSFLSGCTIYRSEGRHQLENEVPKKVAEANAQNFELVQCKHESRLETWWQEEFPKRNYTLVVSDIDLEIWSAFVGPAIEVRVLQRNDNSTESCLYRFADISSWNHHQEQFIFEMRNNLLTTE